MLDTSFDRSRVVEIMDELGVQYLNATKRTLNVYGLYGELHLEMLSRIKEVGFTPKSCWFFNQALLHEGREHDWLDDDCVVGAIFEPSPKHAGRDCSPSLSLNQFRCGDELRDDAVVNFSKALTKRKQSAIRNGFDSFFTPGLISLLGIEEDATFCDTTLNGRENDLKRLVDLPSDPVSIIDEHWSSPIKPDTHFLCGLPYYHHYNLWISRNSEPITTDVAFSTSPFRHVGLERQMIVSKEMARKLVRRRAEVGLDPIYACDSDLAQKQKSFLACLRAGEEASQ